MDQIGGWKVVGRDILARFGDRTGICSSCYRILPSHGNGIMVSPGQQERRIVKPGDLRDSGMNADASVDCILVAMTTVILTAVETGRFYRAACNADAVL